MGRPKKEINLEEARRMREQTPPLSYENIAKQLGCSQAHVWRKLHEVAQ